MYTIWLTFTMENNKKPFKILSIDGGGLKGIYSLNVLKIIETKYCKPDETLSDYFDMFCGTSTGGIIALGLANKMKVNQIQKIYDDNATKIFPPVYKFNKWYNSLLTGSIGFGLAHMKRKNVQLSIGIGLISLFVPKICDGINNIYRQICGCKYNSAPVAAIADEHFGNMKMNDLHNLVCIPSYELGKGSNRVFKFPHNGMQRDKDVTVKDAVMSTSCAPTYFPIHKIDSGGLIGEYLVDGGIWANNPSLVGICEALQYFVGPGKEYEKYELLSIGNISINNNSVPKNDNEKKTFWNALNISTLINILFDSNSKSTSHFCDVISKSHNCFYKRLECNNVSHKLSQSYELDNANPLVLEQYKSLGNSDGYKFTTNKNAKYKDVGRFFINKKTYDVTNNK